MSQKPPKYFRVSPRLWHEPWDNDQRLLALYILTCDHRTMEGLFRLPQAYAQADLGWSQKRIQKAWKALQEQDFIRTSGDVVLVVQALKYQASRNPNQITSAINALAEVPVTELDSQFYALAQGFAEPLAQALHQELPHRFPHPPTPAPSSISIVAPPIPPAEQGGRIRKTNSRTNGTNPRAKEVQDEIFLLRKQMSDCRNELCSHDPEHWTKLCPACAQRNRRISELVAV